MKLYTLNRRYTKYVAYRYIFELKSTFKRHAKFMFHKTTIVLENNFFKLKEKLQELFMQQIDLGSFSFEML